MFYELLQNEEINVTEEIQVVKAVEGYMRTRSEIMPLLEEEDPANDE